MCSWGTWGAQKGKWVNRGEGCLRVQGLRCGPAAPSRPLLRVFKAVAATPPAHRRGATGPLLPGTRGRGSATISSPAARRAALAPGPAEPRSCPGAGGSGRLGRPPREQAVDAPRKSRARPRPRSPQPRSPAAPRPRPAGVAAAPADARERGTNRCAHSVFAL